MSVFGYGIAVVGASIAIGLAAFAAATSTARQPEVRGNLFQIFILAAAFTEALGLIGFVLALIKG
ncbi:MAG: ATP synthase F0 subunit C [Coriobacteriia bacterium]|nr:ATP synthase F0 subunit C [Coriobacteriia bacterium]